MLIKNPRQNSLSISLSFVQRRNMFNKIIWIKIVFKLLRNVIHRLQQIICKNQLQLGVWRTNLGLEFVLLGQEKSGQKDCKFPKNGYSGVVRHGQHLPTNPGLMKMSKKVYKYGNIFGFSSVFWAYFFENLGKQNRKM